jgi:hypothetical protein
MRKAASIARGAASDTSEPSVELISTLKLMSPRPIVTGSIRSSTLRTRSSPNEKDSSKWKPRRCSTGSAMANWTIVPTRTPIA